MNERFTLTLVITTLIFLCSINISYTQWIYQNIPKEINFVLSIDFIDSQYGAGAGNNFQGNFSGRAIYTTNGGNSWMSAIVPDSSRTLITIQFVNSTTGYSSGAYNLFFNDKNFPVEQNRSTVFSSDYFRTNNEMIRGINTNALGEYKGLFFKTTDRGQSWNAFGNLPDSVYYLVGLNFINENKGFATALFDHSGGVDDRIIKTTNGGSSWFQSPMPDVINSLRNIFFTDDNNGYSVGYKIISDTPRAVILKTINSGISWTLQIFPTTFNFNNINFSNSTTGFVIGNAAVKSPMSVIYKTTNAGVNWNLLPLQLKGIFLESIKFVPGTGVGFACGSREEIFAGSRIFTTKTTDYGQTWNHQILSDSGFAVNNFLLDQNNWYMSSFYFDHSFILHSTNSGTGISSINNSVPDDFQLNQNYPNPFNPSTKIKFQISKLTVVNLFVYDILGKEVKTIVNEELQPGTYEAEFDATNLTSGIYFYKITAGNFSEVRKMLLIK